MEGWLTWGGSRALLWAASGLLLFVMAIMIAVLGLRRFFSARRKKQSFAVKTGLIFTVLVLVSGACGLGAAIVGLEWTKYTFSRQMRLLYLAGAVSAYYDQKGALPPSLAEIEVGPYGLGRDGFREPFSGTEKSPSGVQPIYLPVSGQTGYGYIVAVEARTKRTPEKRVYIVLGTREVAFASDQELQQLLSEDDAKREKEGQPNRWASTAWR